MDHRDPTRGLGVGVGADVVLSQTCDEAGVGVVSAGLVHGRGELPPFELADARRDQTGAI